MMINTEILPVTAGKTETEQQHLHRAANCIKAGGIGCVPVGETVEWQPLKKINRQHPYRRTRISTGGKIGFECKAKKRLHSQSLFCDSNAQDAAKTGTNVSLLSFHDNFQSLHQLIVFQFFKIDDGNAELGSAVSRGSITGFGGDNGSFGALPTKTVSQNGEFVECFCLDVTGFTAEKQWNDSSCSHNVDFVRHTAVPQSVVPSNDCAADDIVENSSIDTGFVSVQFQNAAHVP
jgi:hypothetical protein